MKKDDALKIIEKIGCLYPGFNPGTEIIIAWCEAFERHQFELEDADAALNDIVDYNTSEYAPSVSAVINQAKAKYQKRKQKGINTGDSDTRTPEERQAEIDRTKADPKYKHLFGGK